MGREAVRYPRIHLTMDNAFASKRWTRPEEWGRVIRDLGIANVEASADTEADPFYCGPEVLSEWVGEVQRASLAIGFRVANLFTGYTTYRTVGLLHPDPRVRKRVMSDWLGVAAKVAGQLGAGLGFYIHAFPERTLEDPEAYEREKGALYDRLAEVAIRGREEGCQAMAVEQMYSPHQTPWTIPGTKEYLSEVRRRGGTAYVALDTGHHTGQQRFQRPSLPLLEQSLGGSSSPPYLGSESAYALFEAARGRPDVAGAARRILDETARYPHFFAGERDCDLYAWLEEVGAYSPIVHLQQSNGKSSSHLPFVAKNNAVGMVTPKKFLEALAKGYERPADPGMPERVEDIYLTFEIFFGTADRPRDILPALSESVRYWRRFVPADGMRLDELVRRGDEGSPR